MLGQTEASATHFLYSTITWYVPLKIDIQRILTDNGPCYTARSFQRACGQIVLKHRSTWPYAPRPNGKAEHFIQKVHREWAYARTYQNSQERTEALLSFNHRYNWHRAHASLKDVQLQSSAR